MNIKKDFTNNWLVIEGVGYGPLEYFQATYNDSKGRVTLYNTQKLKNAFYELDYEQLLIEGVSISDWNTFKTTLQSFLTTPIGGGTPGPQGPIGPAGPQGPVGPPAELPPELTDDLTDGGNF